MNFLLILTIIESIILGLAVTISFFFSKKLVAAEFNKLIKKVDNNFDKIITLVSGIVLSALIAMALTKCADIFLGRLLNGHEMICESYFRLIVFWVILLTSNYAIVAPAHSKLRILQISDKEAQIIYGKFFRIIWLSFLITVLVSLLMIYAEKFKQIWGYLGAALMATYLFLEMLNSQKFIDRSLAIANPRKSFISFKLTTFISQKITFLCLIGMYGIIFTTRASANMFFFNSLECIYCILVAIFSLQVLISGIINKFVERLHSIEQRKLPESFAIARQKNLIWICDVIVMALYISIICVLLKYMGTSIYEHIFFGKIIVPGAILFATIVLYRGFREFSDFILEKAQRDETGYRVKLQTFLPILSVTFYAVLCITSALLIMANLEINIIPILATSTVFSAVVGFAAQDTIKSFLKGIMLLIEENLYVGAYVKVGNMEGLVERLSVRALYMRGVDGSLYVIPYAVIDTITNYSKDYSYYYDELYFDAKDEIEKISSILVEVIENMRKEKYYQDKILSGVEIYGMKPFDLTGQKIFWRIKTSPDVYGKIVKYEIYRRLYYEYKKHNINVPVANSTVNVIS